MGFISEYASQDDVNKFKLDELWNNYNSTNASYKHHWTIDKETGNWLVPIKKLNNSETIWILHYKNTDIEIKLYKTEDGWDLTSIASNSLNNQEIIKCVQEALEVLGNALIVWAVPKKINLKKEKKKEIKIGVEEAVTKRKITPLDILVFIIVLVIIFFIANDSNNSTDKIVSTIDSNDSTDKIVSTIDSNDSTDKIVSTIDSSNNKTSKKTQKIKSKHNICAVKHDGVFLVNSEDLNTQTKIVDSRKQLMACNADKYGNIYWVDRTNEGLYKANIDGTNIRKIVTLPVLASGLAIDNEGKRIFSAQWNRKRKHHEIVYSDLSGNNKTILLSNRQLLRSVSGMFYDYLSNKLYVSDSTAKQIVVIDLKTKKLKKLVSSSHPVGIVIDYINNKLIWLDRRDKNIYSANFDGSDKKVLIDFNVAGGAANNSNNGALTIDRINNRLIYGYYLQKEGRNQYIVETSNLDGTQRIKQELKNSNFKSFSFFTYSSSYKNGDM